MGTYLAEDIFDGSTGQVYFEAGHELTAEDMAELDEFLHHKHCRSCRLTTQNVGPYIRNTMQVDKCDTREEALDRYLPCNASG